MESEKLHHNNHQQEQDPDNENEGYTVLVVLFIAPATYRARCLFFRFLRLDVS